MTTDQDKQQAIEDYFRAYQKHNDFGLGDVMLGGIPPDIKDHFPSFKKWVLEKMEGEGYYLDIDCTHGCVEWVIDPFGGNNFVEHIVDNEITLAAVQAATRYWREKE